MIVVEKEEKIHTSEVCYCVIMEKTQLPICQPVVVKKVKSAENKDRKIKYCKWADCKRTLETRMMLVRTIEWQSEK